jgi:hypothetical protein
MTPTPARLPCDCDPSDLREHLSLKWGSLKSWHLHGEAFDLLQEWAALGRKASAITHHDTPEQKVLVCRIIDAANVEHVTLDWDGKDVSKDDAKRYVMEYGA